jgi:alanine-synthesizing transaminase
VFLPHEDVLKEAIGRLARFLERYRQKHSRKATNSTNSTATKAS